MSAQVAGGNTGGGTTGGNKDTNCIISTISQVNGGASSESSLTAFYNSNYDVTKLTIYDSASNTKNFEADFTYVTADSVTIDQYQYFILDANGRVIRFKTKSDVLNPKDADNYLYEYIYNSEGILPQRTFT